MATGTILLPASAFWPPDGSTNNLAPKPVMQKGSNTAPNRFVVTWAFPDASTTLIWTQFPMPANYASGGTLRIHAACATAGAGNVRWQSSFGFQTVTASDSYLAHNQATAVAATGSVPATTASRPFETSIALGMDSAAASGICYLLIQRLGADGADTATADIVFLDAALDYTTV